MKKESVLKIEYERIFDKYAIKIVYQNTKILKRGLFNDCGVKSVSCIAYFDNTFYIRGNYEDWDEDIIIVTNEELQDILKRVNKVNEKYGVMKRWRAKRGDVYYTILSTGEIFTITEKDVPSDDERYNIGNYFKTKNEARKVLDSIQWYKLWEDVKEDKL